MVKLDELKESSLYVRGLMDATIAPLFWIGADGNISDVNEAAEGLIGIARDRLTGTNLAIYFKEPEKAKAAYNNTLKKGIIKKHPLVIKKKDGRLTEVLYSGRVYKDDKGDIIGVFATVKEAHSQAEKVLEGAEELISEWGYALDELAFSTRDGFNTFREIENDAAKHWFKATVGKLPKVKTAYESVVNYRDLADERKVISKENFKLEEKGETILGTFLSQDCPYRTCCIERKKENKQFVCFRATPFIVAIRLMAEKEYKADVIYEQTNPGKACMLKGVPTQIAFKVGLSYKLSKGNIKINDIDCAKIGIDIIDKVTVSPSRKELAGRKLTLMSASQTKYPAGMIIMNIADAKGLGLEEKDTVFINKAGEGEDVKLVDTGEYGAKAGEYDKDYSTKGLEVEDKEELIGKETKPEEEAKEKPEEEQTKEVEKPEEASEPAEEPKEETPNTEQTKPEEETSEEPVAKESEEISGQSPESFRSEASKPFRNPKISKSLSNLKKFDKKTEEDPPAEKPAEVVEEPKQEKPQKKLSRREKKKLKRQKAMPKDNTKQMQDFESKIDAIRNT